MKLNEIVFAVVNHDGTIEETPEGLLVSEDKEPLEFMLKAWRVSKSAVEIKRVKIVLIDE